MTYAKRQSIKIYIHTYVYICVYFEDCNKQIEFCKLYYSFFKKKTDMTEIDNASVIF